MQCSSRRRSATARSCSIFLEVDLASLRMPAQPHRFLMCRKSEWEARRGPKIALDPDLRRGLAYSNTEFRIPKRMTSMIPLEPLPNLADQVYERILEAIIDRTLLPGQRVRQNEIAAKL